MPNIDNLRKILNTILIFFLINSFVYSFAGTTPPTTSLIKDPSSPDGNNSWYVSPVEIILNATDLESGVKEINYKIDGNDWIKKEYANTLNLISNPSFETADMNSDIYTKDWSSNGASEFVTYSRDTSNYMSGYQTVSIKIDSFDPNWHSINNATKYAVTTPYNNMSASAWVKTENVLNGVYFKVFAVTQPEGSPVYTQIAQSNSISGSNDWTKLSSTFVVNTADAVGVYIEIGITGGGAMWIDAVSINDSLTATSTQFTISNDGEHTIQYYSVDRAENSESIKSTSFKIDQTPPGNWHDSGAFRGWFGSDHEVYVYTTVQDETSGLSTFTDKYQYKTDNNVTYGIFSNLLGCNSTWLENNWMLLISPPFIPGSKSAYILTPKTDFCNSNWKICKSVKFYAEDLAGNFATKEMCINGPWIKIRGEGIVRSNNIIDMVSESVDGDNTDGLIETQLNSVNFFTTSTDNIARNTLPPIEYTYDTLWNKTTQSKTEITGDLPTSSGVFYISGDYNIDNHSLPNNFSSSEFNQVIFVNGDLSISKSIETSNSSTSLFVVNGDVKIDKGVTKVGIGIFSDNTIHTAYDLSEGEGTSTLELRGIFVANKINLQRNLQGIQNESYPAEDFTYEPKYLVKLGDYIGTSSVKWLNSE